MISFFFGNNLLNSEKSLIFLINKRVKCNLRISFTVVSYVSPIISALPRIFNRNFRFLKFLL
jgi:hypothetical protein